MIHCAALSVHSGRGSKGVVGGGVMEDGTSHAPVAARVVSSPASSAHRKAQSLPGHYNRPPPQSFRDAFTTSKSPTPPSASPGAPRHDAAQCMGPAAPPRGPTSPRATRVGSASAVIGHQYQQQQQQRHHLQQRLQQQEQHMQQQKFEQQKQQQRIQQEQIQQKMQEQHQERLQQQKQAQQKGGESAERQAPEKKSKRSLLSGIFRRRKKGAADSASSSSSTSSESEEPQQRRSFLRRRSKKKDHREREEPLPPPPPPPPAPEAYSPLSRGVGSVRVTPLDTGGTNSLGRETSYMVSSNGRRMVRVAPASLGGSSRGIDIQPLGIPTSLAQQGRRGVSASHDSLPVSLGSWGGSSHASLGYYSGVGMGARSSSTDTISKKERREALKARVERLREKFKDTSSEDEKASVSSHSMYGSESSLSKTNSLTKRTRNARTERYLRRKSQELETLRTETEKDRRNREVVQARIQEIQRVREYEAERNKINEEKKREAEKAHKPRWSAKLVYQESSEYESSVLLRTPSVSPAASPHMKAKFQGHIPQRPAETREAAVVMRNKPQTVTVALAPPSGVPLRRSFQDYEAPMQGDLGSHRSASYDSNINRSSFLMQSSSAGLPSSNRSGLTPPAPPPRDRSRIMSPADGRPMSFSFESLNQDPNRPNSSQSSLSNFTKGSSPSPSVRSVPAYLGPKPNGPQIGPPPLAVPNRRSFSELQLSPQQQSQLSYNTGGPPARPAPPGYPNTQYRYTDQPPRPAAAPNQYYRVQQQHIQPLQQQQHSQQHVQPQQDGSPNNNQLKYYTDMSPQYAKIVPISSVPPSPSSDYSSYMSDNSARLQQVNTAWRQKEKEIKNKKNVSQVMSDSSRSNSPRITEGNNTNNGLSSVEQGEETYGTILTKKPRPPPLSLKQAESLSSLSGQSDVSSPLPKGPDSDSSQSSLAKEKKKIAQNRPLSMVLEKSESAEKDSPPVTPKTRPQPPRRGHRQITTSDLSITKQQILHSIIKHKQEHPQDKPKYQKEFEEMYRKEKERLEKSKCANFEEALKELEEIYDSLRLDNDDILDRAERRDLPTAHQQLRDKDSQETLDSTSETTETDSTVKGRSSRPRTPKMRRSGVPDKKSDDMHFRRCQQSSRNQPDVQKALQMTGSYLLMSPAHTTPTDVDKNIPKDPMLEGEPDIVYDDVSYRNIKQANSIKIIDPQPPFGIPLGPTTQSSPSDYLHVSRKDNYRPKMIARKQPDTTMDDLAFRNLRKDQKDRELNMSELDELLSEANTDSPVHRRRGMRSMSADRVRGMQSDHNLNRAREHSEGPPVVKDKGGKLQTPRRVKHQQEARRAGRFFESYKDALTDGESGMTSPLGPRHNPSWLERANLVDNKWENLSTSNLSTLSTSTETLTEMSSARAVSQPDIRQAIIREARVPTGGPSAWKGTDSQSKEATFTPITSSIATISAPKLVKIQTIQSAPVSPIVVERKPYRPLDSIFNNKPKPFYLADPKPAEQQQKQDPVDIARLDALISTLSKIDTNDEATTPSTPPASSPLTSPLKETNVESVDKTPVVSNTDVSAKPDTVNKPDTSNPLKISEEPVYENVFEPQQSISDPAVPVEKICAKANIEKAIRLSMALESSNSEGNEVSSRRRSAIELPLRDAQPPQSSLSSSISSTNDYCLNVNLYSSCVPGPRSPERVTLLGEEDLSLGPTRAATRKDRVEAMIVTSECVHDRARRAHSVPASPRVVEHAPVFDKIFEIPVKKGPRDQRVVDEAVPPVISECSSLNQNITQSHLSTKLDDSMEGPSSVPDSPQSLIPPESDESESKHQSVQQHQNQTLRSACSESNINLSETPPGDESLSAHAAAVLLLQNEHALQHEVGGQVGRKVGASRPPPLEAPLPPIRSSSLPPSPVRSRDPSFPLHLSALASPSRTPTAVAVETYASARQQYHRGRVARGSSVPAQGRRGSMSSEEEEEEGRITVMTVRAGSLPPTSRLPSTRGAPSGSLKTPRSPVASGPRSCSSGEGRVCQTHASDPSECAWGQSLVAACYLLACITQMAGLDFVTAIGLMLAMASVFATFAL